MVVAIIVLSLLIETIVMLMWHLLVAIDIDWTLKATVPSNCVANAWAQLRVVVIVGVASRLMCMIAWWDGLSVMLG